MRRAARSFVVGLSILVASPVFGASVAPPRQAGARPPAKQSQPPPGDAAQARKDFELGRRLCNEQPPNLQEAVRRLERALSADPSLSEAHFYLGTAYARLGQIKKAAWHYEELLHLVPDHPSAHEVLFVLRDYYKASGEKPRWPLPED